MNASLLSLKLLAGGLLLSLLSACAAPNKNLMQQDPFWAPAYPHVDDTSQSNPGAIYNPTSVQMLFQDKKALRQGDIVTIVLTESTAASKKADTELGKDSSVSLPQATVFGRDLRLLGGNSPLSVSVPAQNRSFKAESDSAQSNRLDGTITVTVHQVYPNGNLMVKGEKWIALNQGSEFIRVAGIVRPEDIDKDNKILSTRIANARISYGGTGPLAETNTQGWLGRFFNSGWWPF